MTMTSFFRIIVKNELLVLAIYHSWINGVVIFDVITYLEETEMKNWLAKSLLETKKKMREPKFHREISSTRFRSTYVLIIKTVSVARFQLGLYDWWKLTEGFQNP
jgi:hypothetical protein